MSNFSVDKNVSSNSYSEGSNVLPDLRRRITMQELRMPVQCATVMNMPGTDYVLITTALVGQYPDTVSEDPMSLRIEMSKGWGWWYCQDVLHICSANLEWIDTTGDKPDPPTERPTERPEGYLEKVWA